ncbi:hypothetical protein VP01_1649g4 [Puccinia sorghi]|uniref:Uncharacterized protein n=1 Tax=Puccinia sorghi TaxID=27349 RepID=A0A0L6VGJ4_9BASI|nr:hypothetical protein VP01_1649g4 [Puccinia sorghi]
MFNNHLTFPLPNIFELTFWNSSQVSGAHSLPAAQYIENQNTERFSILPSISMTGILAMAVTQDTFNGRQ